ncbi:polysaccharide deacetylase family protein [Actinomadura sp. DC4]|uniref:polysaccharide deacetylase family protein n=1 Tax=Actinomadura sp. DC4 TaxID=3055069 RepID=UPI0025B25DC6|nr:polysaccharide deacetylase family protein [Actinomadura sp. DC4]MDN3359820.1 polysaccharide deacetylase family protein [Actinomadura sp. DC4]
MTYPWPGGTRAAVCLTIDFDGESPYLWRSRETRGPAVGELEQRRYGPRRGIENLLAMTDGLGLRTTVFVPGWIAEEYPAQVAAAHERGHELALHGWCHEPPTGLTGDELHDTLDRAARTLAGVSGARPVGYRSPSWDMTAGVFPVLRSLGIGYDSSLMGDDRPYEVDGVVEIPVDWSTDDAPYYRYVGGDPRPPTPTGPILDAWTREIAAAKAHGTLCMLTVHPWLSGRPARVAVLEELLAPVVADPELCTPTVRELAEHHRAQAGGRTVSLDALGRPAHD